MTFALIFKKSSKHNLNKTYMQFRFNFCEWILICNVLDQDTHANQKLFISLYDIFGTKPKINLSVFGCSDYTYVHAPCICLVPRKLKESTGSPAIRVTDSCEPPCRSQTLGLLEELPVLITVQSTLQSK